MLNRKQRAFLKAYAVNGVITDAARVAKVGRRSHYDWMADAEYADAFQDAGEQAADRIESWVIRSATEGIEEPVLYKGELTFAPARDKNTGELLRTDDGHIIITDQPLTIPRRDNVAAFFLLKGLRPEKYRDNVKVEHSGELAIIIERLKAARQRILEQC